MQNSTYLTARRKAFKKVVLKGDRGDKTGVRRVQTKTNANPLTKEILVIPMLRCTDDVKKHRPTKNSVRAIWSMRGRMLAKSKSLHLRRPR